LETEDPRTLRIPIGKVVFDHADHRVVSTGIRPRQPHPDRIFSPQESGHFFIDHDLPDIAGTIVLAAKETAFGQRDLESL